MPNFELALIWTSAAHSEAALTSVRGLEQLLPRAKLARLKVVRNPTTTVLHLDADASLYQPEALKQVKAGAERGGAKLADLVRMNGAVRDEFRVWFLKGEGSPVDCDSYEKAATALAARFQAMRGADAPPAASPTAPAATDGVRSALELVVEFKTDAAFVAEYASNISKGGIFVRTSKRPRQNSSVELRLHLPNGRDLVTSARVVHCFDHPEFGGVGLAFEARNAVFQEDLAQYLSSLA